MASWWPPKKNAAFDLFFNIRDADGDPVTGAAGLDSEVSKDNGAFADCTNEAVEIGTSGIYRLQLTSTEMNADAVCVQTKTSTTGAKTAQTVIYTTESTWDEGIDVKAIGAGIIAAGSIAADALLEIADALLKRDMSAVTGEASRSPLNAFRFLRNKWDIAAGTLTVKKENDSTTAWTGAVSTAPSDPVTGVDPA